jgi:hypothetical protein
MAVFVEFNKCMRSILLLLLLLFIMLPPPTPPLDMDVNDGDDGVLTLLVFREKFCC